MEVCQLLAIQDIKVVDLSLKDAVIEAVNVFNYTGQHVTVKPVGVPLKAQKGKSLVLVDSLEDPRTTVYIKNAMADYKLDLCSNQHSALYAVLGRYAGLNVRYVSIDHIDDPM